MPFRSINRIRYYQFELFEKNLPHGFFTRQGGVSPEPWASLNMGGTVGDNLERVQENRRLALTAVGREQASVYDVWQVHGVEVAITEAPRRVDIPHTKADIILTGTPGITLIMRFADCVPIMLHDPIKKVVGLAHAGWMGTVLGAATVAVKAMHDQFGCKPENILAGIGPSIGVDHYDVGQDVVIRVHEAFGNDASALLPASGEKAKFDLQQANRLLLDRSGLKQIETAGIALPAEQINGAAPGGRVL
jgi:YfiH family protein